jgi:hypothetical protein
MKQRIILYILFVLSGASCKKDKPVLTSTGTITTSHNYGKLAIGNYWIYQRFKIDNIGVVTPLNIYDSCYISKDTIMNGKIYFEMHRPNTYGTFYSYLRDSSDCILDNYGRIKFAPTDFSTVFQTTYATAGGTDTICRAVHKMNHKDSLINTFAGSFITSNFQVTCYMYPNWTHYYNVRYINTCYSENIGIVAETLLLLLDRNSCEERRLVRYQVN